MELKRYGAIVRRRWYVIVFAIAITTGLTYLLESSKAPTYTSTGALQVSCDTPDPGDMNSCNAVLTNNPQIVGNFSTQAQSDTTLRPLRYQLGGANPSAYKVASSVETDTTIIQISVTGPDRGIVLDYTNGIMDALEKSAVGTPWKLSVVDTPEKATQPDGTSKKLVLAIAVLLGFFLGLGIALLMEYLGQSDEREQARDIIDEATGVHNERYLRRRLLEETSRARRSGHGFTFAVLTVALPGGEDGETAHVPPARALRSLARGLDATVPEEGVLGYLGAGTFAALLPEVPVSEASAMLVGWDVAATSLLTAELSGTQGPRVSTALCEYREGVFVGDREAKRPAHWLTSVRMEAPSRGDGAEPVVIVDTEDLQDAAGPAVAGNGEPTARTAGRNGNDAKRRGGRKASARSKEPTTVAARTAKTEAADPAEARDPDGTTPSGLVVPSGSSVASQLIEAARRREGAERSREAGRADDGPAGEGTSGAGERG